jgi:hypothetical protein
VNKVTKLWTTREGEKIRICDMTDRHLLNAIKRCERLHRQLQQECSFPDFGGEMAQMYAEQDFDRFMSSTPEESFPLYTDLCDEAHRRGLDVSEAS